MRNDVAALIAGVFREAGVTDLMDKDLNSHSTISIIMKDDIPTIHIKCEDDEVWVWTKLGDYNLSVLSYCSASLFPVMFNYNEDFFYAGQPCLYSVDGILELRAQIKEKHLESTSTFSAVLNHYLTVLNEYRVILM